MTRKTTGFLVLVLVASWVATPVGQQLQPQPPPRPTFRSAVTLVPVDVRVTDKDGKPLTDLQADEFSLFENGVRQDIRHFSVKSLVPLTPPQGGKGLELREEAFSIEPQTNRIFLLVLGRGKLQEPSRALDALITFVRQQLLPQDQVAVFAYNRATTFTRDHESVARLIERFKPLHEQVDYEIELQMSGLAAIYGSKSIPTSLQKKVDQLFEGSGLLASTRVSAADAAGSRVEKDAGRQSDAQIQKEAELAKADMAAAAGVTNLTTWSEIDEISTQMFADLSLDDFVSATARTLQDLGNLYAAIAYLRNFEGEKHVVFFTEKGLAMPRAEEDEVLAAAANDARVALDTVETGGIYVGQAGGAMPAGRWSQTFAFKTLRSIAELTGGVSSIAEAGATALNRLDQVTRSGYLLGYYPSGKWDGNYRKLEVKVSRPGAQVHYRHGYYGRQELQGFNRREFVTNDRIRAAASFRREIKDIKVSLEASIKNAEDGSGPELRVAVAIDPSKLAMTFVEGVHVGRVSIAVFWWDQQGNGLGNSMVTADIKLQEDVYRQVLKTGIPFKTRFGIRPGVRRVRVVVYDPKADLVGSVDRSVL